MNDTKLVNYLKGLIIDGVHKAQSGHPGGPLSALDFAYILHTEFLSFDPEDPEWLARDRFILSAGHASMLQYSLLFASGLLEMSDLQNFRQFSSKTPGHPENFQTPGVECTTGPLGQGCAMSVGFAIAEAHLASQFGSDLFNNKTWVILGDGCLQEDVTLGAASLAGHLKLNQLIWFYDKNSIQISGAIDRATSDDEIKIFEGFGWNTISIDGHDHSQIRQAIKKALAEESGPTLIVGQTQIAKGVATMEGSEKTHGSPLPLEEYKKTRELLGLNPEEMFSWTEEATQHFQRNFSSKRKEVQKWKERWESKRKDRKFSERCDELLKSSENLNLPRMGWNLDKNLATRNAFGKLIEYWSGHTPKLIGGSADLEPSNVLGGFAKKVGDFSSKNHEGRNLAFGVREFPMSAICNGIALYGAGFIPFDATFLVFSDYARPALRLGALQNAHVIHEYTHDSFFLGEDGPTHQPVEHLMSLRMIPQLNLVRPADALETEVLLAKAMREKEPSCFALSRQGLPHVSTSFEKAKEAGRGAWVLRESSKDSDLIFFATGSEVSLALSVAEALEREGKSAQVVSVPCWEWFFQEEASYIEKVLNWKCKRRVSIEAGVAHGWERFIGHEGLIVSIDRFGESAPGSILAEHFGFTEKSILERVKKHFNWF